jgi:23S rRNA pseudouridine1911/1915/1917 synthase
MTQHEGHRRFRFVAAEEDGGRRLDQVLAARIPELSRRQARVLLDLGGVFVDGARTKVAGRLVRPGAVVVANVGGGLRRATKEVGEAARARDDAALPPWRVVHEDADLVVVDKPSGLLTAPTPEGDRGTLAHALGRALGPVLVVHRLDLETSGLLVFARTEEANRALAERFRTHDLDREYVAVLAGATAFDARTIEAPVAGRRAVTHVAVVERFGERATLVRCRLETGRTHQIRLHALEVGHPVLGDRRYGAAPPAGLAPPPRLALHATRLGFRHPRTGEALTFDSPWPPDLAAWLEGLRGA